MLTPNMTTGLEIWHSVDDILFLLHTLLFPFQNPDFAIVQLLTVCSFGSVILVVTAA